MDEVNPHHYNKHKIQPIDIIEEYHLNFHLGNVVKYICRHRDKGGLTDLKKARWYLDKYINSLDPDVGTDVPKSVISPPCDTFPLPSPHWGGVQLYYDKDGVDRLANRIDLDDKSSTAGDPPKEGAYYRDRVTGKSFIFEGGKWLDIRGEEHDKSSTRGDNEVSATVVYTSQGEPRSSVTTINRTVGAILDGMGQK